MKPRHQGNSFNELLRSKLAIDIERDQWAKLEEWVGQHPGARINPYALAKKTGVPLPITRRFCTSLVYKSSNGQPLEEKIISLACQAENQIPYEEGNKDAIHWFCKKRIRSGAGLPHGEASVRRVTAVLEKYRDAIFSKVAEAVFSSAYSIWTLVAYSQASPNKYYMAVAASANTRPETAKYILEKHFGMPAPNVILDLSRKHTGENLTLEIAAQAFRAISSGNFRNGNLNIIGLAKHLDEQGVGQPMEVAAGLVKVWEERSKDV